MIVSDMILQLEKEIHMSEYINEDYCCDVSADLLRYVLVVLKSLNPELEITNQ